MRAVSTSLVALLIGCGGQPLASTATGPGWPDLCPGEPRAHTAGHASEDPDCWRAHFPVRSCDDPLHPELIGLWGLGGRRFEGRLLYDGCCVTFDDEGSLRWGSSLNEAFEWATLGRAPNVGRANRSRAVWEGDRLDSDSLWGRFAVGRREVLDDGTARLVFVHHGGRPEVPLVRLQAPSCIDEVTRDLLCARLIIPGAQHTPAGAGGCGE